MKYELEQTAVGGVQCYPRRIAARGISGLKG